MHITKKNIFFIKKLYQLIKKKHKKEIPIGALITQQNNIISLKKNSNKKKELLDHAECLVIKEALNKKNESHNYILYCSLEPCLMCVGAAINAGIKIIYYLCKSPESGVQTKFNLICIENISIIPILIYEKKIKNLLKSFFYQKRIKYQKKSQDKSTSI